MATPSTAPIDPQPAAPPADPATARASLRRVVLVVALLTLVRFVLAAVAPITEDEAYYRLWALHPAFGYLDHPPMVAWWIAGGIAVLGDSALGVRAPFVLATAIGTLALWRTAAILFGMAAAARAAIWFNATLLVGLGAMLATPDGPSALFWGLALWAAAEWHAGRDGRWWLAFGLFAGLGLLSKYSVLFLGAGIVLWLALAEDRRRVLLSPWLWLGGVLAAALFAPVVSWNAGHEWASFAKQFGRAAADGVTWRYLPELLGGQIGLLGPLMLPFLVLGILGRPRPAPADMTAAGRNPLLAGRGLLVATSAPFVLYLLLHALHDRVQANWPAPLYGPAALLAAAAAGAVPEGGRPRLAALVPWVATAGFATTVAAAAFALHPLPGLERIDPLARFRGWEQVARSVDKAADRAGAAWIATDGYGATAMLADALRDRPVIQLDERIRYDSAPPPDPALLAEPAIVVVRGYKTTPPAWLAARFASLEPYGVVWRQAGAKTVGYSLFRASAPQPGVLTRD